MAPPPPPDSKLPASLVVALGLTGASCSNGGDGTTQACLNVSPCLDYVTYETGDTGDTGETGDTGATSTTPLVGPVPPAPPDVVDRVLDRDVLPDDVAARLRARLDQGE